MNATQGKLCQRRGKNAFMGGVTQRALRRSEAQHRKIIADNLAGDTGGPETQQELERQVEAPGLSNGSPLFPRQRSPGFRAQGQREIARRKRPQDGTCACDTSTPRGSKPRSAIEEEEKPW